MKSTASEPGLRNLDDCYVDLEYIFCIKSSLHFHFDAYSLTNKRRANPKVIYLGSLMLMPQQQHYTCHIRRSFIHQPEPSLLNSNQPFLFCSIWRLRDCHRRLRTFLHLVHRQFTSLGTMDGQHS